VSDHWTNNPNKWHGANNGSGKRTWFVTRGAQPMQIFSDVRGQYVRYATQEGAERRAAKLNKTREGGNDK
jgi:hypothetical protein